MVGSRIVYVADPMCSWSWGFAAVLDQLKLEFGGREGTVSVEWGLAMGGLAPDSSLPMPRSMRAYVQGAWDEVERVCGASFNREFWTTCEPRRSTFGACRAVLVAEELRAGAGWEMFAALQHAYYLEARNPSLTSTLIDVAAELDPPLDLIAFAGGLDSPRAQERLELDLDRRRRWGADAFPSLVLEHEGSTELIMRGYAPLAQVRPLLRARLGMAVEEG